MFGFTTIKCQSRICIWNKLTSKRMRNINSEVMRVEPTYAYKFGLQISAVVEMNSPTVWERKKKIIIWQSSDHYNLLALAKYCHDIISIILHKCTTFVLCHKSSLHLTLAGNKCETWHQVAKFHGTFMASSRTQGHSYSIILPKQIVKYHELYWLCCSRRVLR